jgi:hypothetical protein
MKKPIKKPSGDIRIIEFSFDEKNTIQQNIDMQFPEQKEELEKLVVELFLKSWTSMFTNKPPKLAEQNKQYDLDFMLEDLNGGKYYLELTELVPFKMGTKGFTSINNQIDQNILVENLTTIIKAKSIKYSGIKSIIDLLIYYTDDCAELGLAATCWIQIWLNTNKHRFRNIFLFKPLPNFQNKGYGFLLYPNPNKQTEFPPLDLVYYIGVKPK